MSILMKIANSEKDEERPSFLKRNKKKIVGAAALAAASAAGYRAYKGRHAASASSVGPRKDFLPPLPGEAKPSNPLKSYSEAHGPKARKGRLGRIYALDAFMDRVQASKAKDDQVQGRNLPLQSIRALSEKNRTR